MIASQIPLRSFQASIPSREPAVSHGAKLGDDVYSELSLLLRSTLYVYVVPLSWFSRTQLSVSIFVACSALSSVLSLLWFHEEFIKITV